MTEQSIQPARSSSPPRLGFARCTVSLVLLMDRSSSVFGINYEANDRFTMSNWQRQVNDTAAALSDPETVRLIESQGGLAVRANSFDDSVQTMVDWQVIRNQEDADRFASSLRRHLVVERGGGTQIGHAVQDSMRQFESSPCDPDERIVDVSTDGRDSNPHAARRARRAALENHIRINGIAIGEGDDVEWMRDHLITQENGGFAIQTNWAAYDRDIRRKLVREIAQGGSGQIEAGIGSAGEPDLTEPLPPLPTPASGVAEAALAHRRAGSRRM